MDSGAYDFTMFCTECGNKADRLVTESVSDGVYLIQPGERLCLRCAHSRGHRSLAEIYKDSLHHGDYSRIARIYSRRHLDANKGVSPQYVRMILMDESGTHKSPAALEIREIAEQYFTVRSEYDRMLLET
jgi:hypothetical protein